MFSTLIKMCVNENIVKFSKLPKVDLISISRAPILFHRNNTFNSVTTS